MQKRLMVLGAGLLQIPIIKKARDLGYYTIVVDGDEHAAGLKLADKPIVDDITDPEEMLRVAIREKIDGVIHPCSEVAMNCMGYINEKLNLAGVKRDVIERATNKEKMRRAFEEYGAPSPKSFGLNSFDGIESVLGQLKGDFIIKPSRSSGSRGVTKIIKGTDIEIIREAFDRAYNESRDNSVVIEDFVDGPEFSVEIIVYDSEVHVLAVTDKKTTEAPYFVELGHNQPSLFSKEDTDKIKDAAIRGVKALGLSNCEAHAEVKLSKDGAFLMEIGARLGGDFISTELVHLSTGIDMVAASLSLVLGLKPDLEPKTKGQGAAIRYFTPKPGVVTSIENTEIANKEYVQCIDIYSHIGDTIRCVKSSLDRSGHVIVVGKDAKEAVERAEYIVDNINIITE